MSNAATPQPAPSPGPKPEWTTPGFWTMVVNYVVNITVAVLALMHPGYHLAPNVQNLVSTVIPTVCVVAAAIGSYIYAHNHTKLKLAAIEASLRQNETASYERVAIATGATALRATSA